MTPAVEFVLIHPDSQMPVYSTMYAAGADLFAYMPHSAHVIDPNCTIIVPTGIRIKMDMDYVGFIHSRSGLAAQHGVFVLNSPGVIDPDYENEIKVILHNASTKPFVIHHGDRIAQFVFASRQPSFFTNAIVKEEVRGLGGLGSTGV